MLRHTNAAVSNLLFGTSVGAPAHEGPSKAQRMEPRLLKVIEYNWKKSAH